MDVEEVIKILEDHDISIYQNDKNDFHIQNAQGVTLHHKTENFLKDFANKLKNPPKPVGTDLFGGEPNGIL